MNPWQDRPIRELCTSIIDCVNKTAPIVSGPTPYKMIRTTNVKNGRVDLANVRHVDEEVYRRWVRRGVPADGDIVLTREAPLGEVGMLHDPAGVFLGQRLVMYRADPELADRNFLFHAMRSPTVQAQIKAFGSGSTVEHMRVPDCGELLISCPDVSTQRRLGAVLVAFDELIEINERRIELLEDLARSLYHEWFVRFRFPGSAHTLDADVLPDAWRTAAIGEFCDIVRGRSYRRDEISENAGVLFLNLKCVSRGGGFRRDGLKRYTGRFKDTQRVRTGDVLVAVTDMTQERRIVARAFRMPELDDSFGVPSLDLVVVRPRTAGLRTYLYAFLRYTDFADRVRHFANGANVLHLAVERILEAPLVVPDERTLRGFTFHCEALLSEAEFLERANRHLAATRDLLLPRLVTGRLDMSDVNLGDLLPAEAV